MKRSKKLFATCLATACLAVFLPACEEEIPEKEYKPYDYDLASYIKIDSFLGVEYTPVSTDVTESEIEYRIITELKNAGLYETDFSSLVQHNPEGEIKLGDLITFTCTATVDGDFYPEACTENRKTEVGKGTVTVEGFENGLIGATLNEEIKLSLVLPSDYADYKLRNKPIEFTVTVTQNEKRYLCPDSLNEEQLAKVSNCTSFAEYYESIRETLTEEKRLYAEQRKLADCWNALLSRAQIISYPQIEMELYVEKYLEYLTEQAKNQGFSSLEDYAENTGTTVEELSRQGMAYARGDVLQEMAIYYVARAEGFDKMSDELFNQFALPYAKELKLDSVDILIEVVGYDGVQKAVLTDVVKRYIADNAVAKISDSPEESNS